MNWPTGTILVLLILVACTVPPQAQEEIVLPVIVVDGTKKDEIPDTPKPEKPRHKVEVKPKPEGRKADKVCPPVEGETDNQRILRKLDCLIERD